MMYKLIFKSTKHVKTRLPLFCGPNPVIGSGIGISLSNFSSSSSLTTSTDVAHSVALSCSSDSNFPTAPGLTVLLSTLWRSVKYSLLSSSKLVSFNFSTNSKCFSMFTNDFVGSHRPVSNTEQVCSSLIHAPCVDSPWSQQGVKENRH